jgi:hypothetical protein
MVDVHIRTHQDSLASSGRFYGLVAGKSVIDMAAAHALINLICLPSFRLVLLPIDRDSLFG